MKMNVYFKPVGKRPSLVDVERTTEAIQKLIGGYFELVHLASDAVILCDEEGKLKNLPYNCTVCGTRYYGPIILAGTIGSNLSSVNKSTITLVEKWGLIR